MGGQQCRRAERRPDAGRPDGAEQQTKRQLSDDAGVRATAKRSVRPVAKRPGRRSKMGLQAWRHEDNAIRNQHNGGYSLKDGAMQASCKSCLGKQPAKKSETQPGSERQRGRSIAVLSGGAGQDHRQQRQDAGRQDRQHTRDEGQTKTTQVPPKSKTKAWLDLRQQVAWRYKAYELNQERLEVAELAAIESEIEKLERLPPNPGRASGFKVMKRQFETRNTHRSLLGSRRYWTW